MKVWKIAAATWLALFVIAGQAHAAEEITPAERFENVRYQTLHPHNDWSIKENLLTIRAAFAAFGMHDGIARCIAWRESRYNEDAYNSYSGASGLFQHLRSYWPGRAREYNAHVRPALKIQPRANVFSARASALVTARMVRNGGWGPWGGGC